MYEISPDQNNFLNIVHIAMAHIVLNYATDSGNIRAKPVEFNK